MVDVSAVVAEGGGQIVPFGVMNWNDQIIGALLQSFIERKERLRTCAPHLQKVIHAEIVDELKFQFPGPCTHLTVAKMMNKVPRRPAVPALRIPPAHAPRSRSEPRPRAARSTTATATRCGASGTSSTR